VIASLHASASFRSLGAKLARLNEANNRIAYERLAPKLTPAQLAEIKAQPLMMSVQAWQKVYSKVRPDEVERQVLAAVDEVTRRQSEPAGED
jgi:hypothetical protein